MTFGEWIDAALYTINGSSAQVNDTDLRRRYAIAGQRVINKAWEQAPLKRTLTSGSVTMDTGADAGRGSMPSNYGAPGPHMKVYVSGGQHEIDYVDEGTLFHFRQMNSDQVSTRPQFYTFRDQSVLGRKYIHTFAKNDGAMTLNIEGYVRKPPKGVDRPGRVTTAEGIAGNLTGAYTYKVTFVTADGETEGGEVSVSRTVTAKKIELSGIPVSHLSTVTSRKIYRTVGGGTQHKLVATLSDNTTTTYSDNVADGSLGANVPTAADAVTGLEMFPEQYHDGCLLDALLLIVQRNQGDGRTGEFTPIVVQSFAKMWASQNPHHVPTRMPRYNYPRGYGR